MQICAELAARSGHSCGIHVTWETSLAAWVARLVTCKDVRSRAPPLRGFHTHTEHLHTFRELDYILTDRPTDRFSGAISRFCCAGAKASRSRGGETARKSPNLFVTAETTINCLCFSRGFASHETGPHTYVYSSITRVRLLLGL